MTAPDRVRQYLRRRGCPTSVVNGGLKALIDHWSGVVEGVEEGYDLTMPDYITDMDNRDLLAGAIEYASQEEQDLVVPKLKRLDKRFLELTTECGPVKGARAAHEDGHDREQQWWYFRRPKTPGPDFELELEEAGLL